MKKSPSRFRGSCIKARKAQVNALDFSFALIIFFVIIALFEFNWRSTVERSQPLEGDLTLESYHSVNTLLESGGYPVDWTPENVQLVGICDERNVINKEKLARLISLVNTDYARAKGLLGVGANDFYFNVTDTNGQVIYVNGMQASAGMPPSSARLAMYSTSVMQISSLVRSNNSIAIVFDQSGSMNDRLPNGALKIDSAKNATNEFLIHIVPGDEVAVTTFRNCGNLYALQNFTYDMNEVRWAVRGLTPSGWTPLAGVTEFTGDYVRLQARNLNKAVIILSDGEETCDEDTAAAASYAMAQGVDVIHTIGFVITPGSEGERQLKEMAAIGGGSYYAANDSQELYDAFIAAYASSEKQVVVNIVVWR